MTHQGGPQPANFIRIHYFEESGLVNVLAEVHKRFFDNTHPIQFKHEKDENIIATLDKGLTEYFPIGLSTKGIELEKEVHNAIYKLTGLKGKRFPRNMRETKHYINFGKDVKNVLVQSMKLIKEKDSDGVRHGSRAQLADDYKKIHKGMNDFFNNRYYGLADNARTRIEALRELLTDSDDVKLMEKLGITDSEEHLRLESLGKKLGKSTYQVEDFFILGDKLEWLIYKLFNPEQGSDLKDPDQAYDFTINNKGTIEKIAIKWEAIYNDTIFRKSP